MSAKKKHIFGEREVIKSEDTLTREDMMKRVIFSQAHKEIKTEDLVPTHVVHSRVTDAIAKREAAENVSEPEPLCGYQDFQKGRGYPDEPRKHRDDSLMSEEFDLTSDVPLRAITASKRYQAKVRNVLDASLANTQLGSLVQKLKVTTIRTPEETEGRHAQTARKKRMKKPDLISQYELIRRAYSDKCLMYLVFAVTPDSVYYTPYSLKIVTFDDIESYNYMTMSRTGVSQYHPDGVMYTTLEEWKEEYDMYLDVIRIPAFRQFRMWKSFWIWRKAVKWAKMCLARNILLEELLILNKEIRVSLMDIQAMCCTMDNVSFINMKKEEHFAIFDYMEIQLGKVENTMVKIHEYHQIVKQIVTTSCYGALTSIGFTIDDSNFLPPEACAPSARRNVRDKRQRMQYIDQANKKKFCKRLTCFIHLVDYLVMNSLHVVMKNSLLDLQYMLKRHFIFLPSAHLLRAKELDAVLEEPRPEEYPEFPLFHVELLNDTENMYLDPPHDIVIGSFNELIELWEEYLFCIDIYLPDPIYNPFTEPMINGKKMERFYALEAGVDIRKLFEEDSYLEGLKKITEQYFEVSYKAIDTYISRFDFVRKFYKRNESTDLKSILDCKDVVAFREMLERYHFEMQSIAEIPETQALGIFLLHLQTFIQNISPSPERLLVVVEYILPCIGRDTIERLIEDAAKAQKKLTMSLKTTKDFVTFLDFLDNATAKADYFETTLDYCKEVYDLIDEYGIPVNPEEVAQYLGFNVQLASLRNFIDQKMDERESIILKFQERLSKDINALMSEIGDVKDEAVKPWLIDIKSKPEEAKSKLNKINDRLMAIQKKANEYRGYQKQFRLETTRMDLLDEVMNDVRLRRLMWKCRDDWDKLIDTWTNCDFTQLDPEEMHQTLLQYTKNINQLEKGLPENEIVPILRENLEEMKAKLPTITNLRNPALKPRHWLQIEHILDHKFAPEDKITLASLQELGTFDHAEELQEVSGQASSEAGLEAMLKKVEDSWKSAEFIVLPHRDYKDVFILAGIEDIQQILDDSLIAINTIASSRHVGPIKPRVDEWAKNLDLFSKTMDSWLTCQQNWMYLESIFCAPDIQRQLPHEAKMFQAVDKSFKAIMRKTYKNPLALQACIAPEVLESFEENNKLLDEIMKCLENYLESKRVIFPRFYFLSNEELLEILAQTRNPHAVQPHLKKCFDAIAKLEFGSRSDDTKEAKGSLSTPATFDISAMISPEGEKVYMTRGLKARGNVEDWLGKVEENMFFTLKKRMRMAVQDSKFKKKDVWIFSHPNQIILTASQILWARDVHDVLDDVDPAGELDRFEEKSFDELNKLAAMVRGHLSKLNRQMVCSLITVDVHARDIISYLIEATVDGSNRFEWLKQLRYYWDDDLDNCLARMSSACHFYGYEYLGAGPRLVITPLTDRCYLCLMGALQMDLGGAPAGPAGTGKTETTKDLAKALAIQCVVFNCSEGLDYKMMGKFFSGLAQAGAWCCFDEFNRIDIEVLSVIAQQLITIRNAKVAKEERFMFEGRMIKLVPQCAAFITMNPGYAGRTELPDNLKALFRPISMMVPDYALIAEVILYSEGFESSKVLAHKMTQMYKLCSEQLSQQDHYDFGMRAVKSVLVMAGGLKRDNPDNREDVVLIRALRDSNLPKFLANDATLFQGILNDLFPGVEIPKQDYGSLLDTMLGVLFDNLLEAEPCFVTKVIQLYDTMIVRHGVMLVGPTGGGKTTILQVLAETLTRLYEEGVKGPYYRPVTTNTLNPKSITIGELYGCVNPYTFEWRDGLLGIMVRKAVQTDEEHQWVVCDGPVDAVWIENMNTVLDDNKMLCLANSERIKLTAWVHMVFEVEDLAQASPATVSRCGMVYVDAQEMGWLPFVKQWLLQLGLGKFEDHKDYLQNLFETYVQDGLDFINRYCEPAMVQVQIALVATLCSLMESLITYPGVLEETLDSSRMKALLSQSFCFGYIWAFGGNLIENYQEMFEVFARELLDQNADARLPSTGNLWSLFMDPVGRRLDLWSKITPDFKYDPEVAFFDILVPTIDTIRCSFVMTKLLSVNKPVLLTGLTGVGKSVVAKSVLRDMSKGGDYIPVSLTFSAQTTSERTQQILENKLEKRKKTVLGPPLGKKLVFFVDDVNMPKLDKYGSQPPIELLRQYLDFDGLYDREKMFWKKIKDVTLACACGPPGGGRNPMTARFIRHFGMLLVPSPTEETLKVIFRAILYGFLDEFSAAVRKAADPIVSCSVDVYNRISAELLPTPDKSHYVFNLRDLSKCVQGILQADPEVIRETNQILRLFYHECLRVFHDRLINVEDKSYFYHMMKECCVRSFSSPIVEIPNDAIIENPPRLMFGDFMTLGENKIYQEITDVDKCKDALMDALLDYNTSSPREMNLIFFMDAISHALRIARILRSERGNALLVGLSGMGKQSLTRLSSTLCSYKCFQIELTRQYDHESFKEDLRKLFTAAGGKNEDNTFLITDSQIVQEEFLEDINCILNSGEVPNLFEADEYEKVIIMVRPAAKLAGVVEADRDGIYDFFIGRVRTKLHVVICMSPVGDTFRSRCRMFPSLVNCCTIDWFNDWPEEALTSVAEEKLKNVGDVELVGKLSYICVHMHQSVGNMSIRFREEVRRYYYTTPSSYLELLKLYIKMLDTQNQEIKKRCNRIATGLKKILQTNDIVDTMKIELTAMEPELQKKSEATEKLMVSLAKEQEAADKVRQVVKEDEITVQGKAEITQALADDAQRDLDEALPAMVAAMKALDSLNKTDINELRVFNKPPHLVRFVMEAVCVLLNSKTDWATAKVILGDTNFLKKLRDYDKNNISDATLKKLASYVNHPDFVPETVATQSKVCKSICMWVRAIDRYAKVYRIVEPKRKKLEEAETELESVMAVLKEKQAKLAEVENQIAQLEKTYDASVQEKTNLEHAMELTALRLIRAGKLTTALADEQVRWQKSVETLTEQTGSLIGDILLAAACVAYFGAFTVLYREELLNVWVTDVRQLKIPSSNVFGLINVLADPFEIRQWNSQGLPRDALSTENAVLVTRGERWPLMIDPQEQANRWIRNMESGNKLLVVTPFEQNLQNALENAIRVGRPVLLEGVSEYLDPSLNPLLQKTTYLHQGRLLIHFGDKEIDFDANFKLYITTKLSNPHYLPEVCIMVTLVNFTVTKKGLEDQLLSDVVRLERPDLEKKRNELVTAINDDKNQLQLIEDKILKLLFQSTGNILDDEELISTLNESKVTSAEINKRLELAETTEASISKAREKYRIVATRGSILYFVVAQLSELDPMYQYSLKYFNQIFNTVIEHSEKSKELHIRLNILINATTKAVYIDISRGLFERHKLIYSFLLCAEVQKGAELISPSEWNFLLRGPVGTIKDIPPKPPYVSVTDPIWKSIIYLQNLFSDFKDLSTDCLYKIHITIGKFKLVINLVKDAKTATTDKYDNNLEPFSKLLLIKALQEEKIVFAMSEYVSVSLGKEFIESVQVNLSSLYQDTSNTTPLIFVLSTGSDPFGQFQRFAAEMKYLDKLQAISLGQGQGPIAEGLIRNAVGKGHWVFLQNCHLATSWMFNMEVMIQEISNNPKDVHEAFRLYLSSMPSKSFPVSVLQNSVKVTNEPPKGLRANLKRAFADMKEEFFEENVLKGQWRTIVFGLCLFHAVIQERKKFGPLGWNITYEFNDSDRECALTTFEMFCGDSIPWDALEYITGDITYGGRVTDHWDLRCLKTILKKYFSEETLKPGHRYCGSMYYIRPEAPRCFTLEHYRKFIELLPTQDDPDVFGMHENANITFQKNETGWLLQTLLDIQPRESAGGEERSADEMVYEMAEIILGKLVEKIHPDEIHPELAKRDDHGRVASLTTVLLQEVDRYNKLLEKLLTSLDNLQKAIKGLIVMSELLEQVFNSIYNNQVPQMWGEAAYPSLKSLSSWIFDLQMRIDFIYIWLLNGKPVSFWISGFFFPQGFLTGTLQTHARKYGLPIDELNFEFDVHSVKLRQEKIFTAHVQNGNEDPKELYLGLFEPEDGVYVHGIFIDAANWNSVQRKLVDAKGGQMHGYLPVMLMTPTDMKIVEEGRYHAPLYKTALRAGVLSTTGHSTNFVITCLLPSYEDESFWILRGTALLTQLTD